MARRKKRQRETPPPRPPKPAPEPGSLAEKLLLAASKLEQQRRADAADAARRAEEERLAAEAIAAARPKPRLTVDEAMARAFDALDDRFTGAEKFEGEGFDPGDVEIVRVDEPAFEEPIPGPEPDEPTAEDLLFVEAMTEGVERIDNPYAELRTKDWSGLSWRTEPQLAALTAADLRSLEMSAEQRQLLSRSRRAGVMAVIHIRHMRLQEALGEVEAGVRSAARESRRFVRVIHGKGHGSSGDPVLKPAVINWCEGAGATWVRGWAPERDFSGQFGSIVVELRRRPAS